MDRLHHSSEPEKSLSAATEKEEHQDDRADDGRCNRDDVENSDH
jgi:hypothetical protein